MARDVLESTRRTGRYKILELILANPVRSAGWLGIIASLGTGYGLTAVESTYGYLNDANGDNDCGMYAGTKVLWSTNAAVLWTTADIGKTVHVQGAAAGGATLVSTILALGPAGASCVLADVCATAVSPSTNSTTGLAVWGWPPTEVRRSAPLFDANTGATADSLPNVANALLKGDNLASVTNWRTALANLGQGKATGVPTLDASGRLDPGVLPSGSSGWREVEHWIGPSGAGSRFLPASAGGGAITYAASTVKAQANAGNAGAATAACCAFADGSAAVELSISLDTLSVAGQRFDLVAGWFDVLGTLPTDGLILRQRDDLNAGKLRLESCMRTVSPIFAALASSCALNFEDLRIDLL